MKPEEMIGKVLREGHTTGATAAGAMKAAVLAMRGEFPKTVTVLSPQRQEIVIPVDHAEADGEKGCATCLKDAGDDLDCTNGTPIVVTVELKREPGMELRAGKGVGIVTRPGLQVAVGKPAINPGPQIMCMKSSLQRMTASSSPFLSPRGRSWRNRRSILPSA